MATWDNIVMERDRINSVVKQVSDAVKNYGKSKQNLSFRMKDSDTITVNGKKVTVGAAKQFLKTARPYQEKVNAVYDDYKDASAGVKASRDIAVPKWSGGTQGLYSPSVAFGGTGGVGAGTGAGATGGQTSPGTPKGMAPPKPTPAPKIGESGTTGGGGGGGGTPRMSAADRFALGMQLAPDVREQMGLTNAFNFLDTILKDPEKYSGSAELRALLDQSKTDAEKVVEDKYKLALDTIGTTFTKAKDLTSAGYKALGDYLKANASTRYAELADAYEAEPVVMEKKNALASFFEGQGINAAEVDLAARDTAARLNAERGSFADVAKGLAAMEARGNASRLDEAAMAELAATTTLDTLLAQNQGALEQSKLDALAEITSAYNQNLFGVAQGEADWRKQLLGQQAQYKAAGAGIKPSDLWKGIETYVKGAKTIGANIGF